MTRVPDWAGPSTHAAVLDRVDVAIVATDVGARVTTWNARAAALYGWPAEEAIGTPVTELLIPDGEEAPLGEIRARLRSGSTWQGALRLKRRDGSRLTAFVKTSPLVDDAGEVTGAVSASIELADPELVSAIRSVALTSGRDGRRAHVLSPREREILGLLARGLTGEQIAARLVLSPETIRTHIRNAREKLGASTRVEAVTMALVAQEIEFSR